MSTVDQLSRGLELTVIGMVTVFLLLTLMVFVIGWMSRLAHHLQPPARGQGNIASVDGEGRLDPTLVSAITAAVHRYRRKHR
jgi:oxaloacetate decarboxylase gamma subunit